MSRLKSRLPFAFALLLLALGVNAYVTYRNTYALLSNGREQTHSREILEELGGVLTLLQDAETGQRGYLLVGDPEYLKPYSDAVSQIHRRLDHLDEVTAGRPKRSADAAALRRVADAKLTELDLSLRALRDEGPAAALARVASGVGKARMDEFRALVGRMTADEQARLADLVAAAARASQARTVTFGVATAAAVATLLFAFALARRDLFDRERARAEAERQRELLGVTLASIGDAVMATDREGRVTLLNDVAERLTGWSRHEAAGRPLDEVFRIINEDSREPAESPAARALREGKVVGLANHTLLVARDGREMPIDDSAAPIRDAGGGVVGVVLVFRDVTDAKAAERAVRASEARFRTMADSAPVLVWIADRSAARVWFNKPWLDFVGRPLEREAGDGWMENMHPADLDRCRHTYRTAFDRRVEFTMEYRLRRHDGEYRWVLSRGVPLHDAGGAFTGYVGSAVDIQDRRTLEEAREGLLAAERAARAEAEQANRTKDEFLAVLSHELRTPLSPVLTTVRLLEADRSLPATVYDDLRTIRRNAELEARLIDDLLDLTRVARNKVQLQLETVDTHIALRQVFEVCCSDINAKRQRLDLRLNATRHHVRADAARLQQIFWNLIKNASKFTPEQGEITVATADAPGGLLRVEVRDTGVGIDPAMIPRLFNAFEQGDRNVTRQFGGLGLGLAITKALAEIHGGRVTAESEGPGKGATFAIELPVVEPTPAQPPPPGRPAAGHAGGLRVLVVEDHADTRQTMARLLTSMGYQVEAAGDVAAGLRAALAREFDVILSDIGLPDGTGIDFVSRLRASKATPAIALTGFGMEDDVRKSLAAGFVAHLTKPVNFDKLELLIRQVAAKDGQGVPA